MSSSDDDVPAFVVLMDYLVRKLRKSSRIPKQVSMLSGYGRMMELLSVHDGCFLDVLRINKDCFYRLCNLLSFNNGVEEMRSITVQERSDDVLHCGGTL